MVPRQKQQQEGGGGGEKESDRNKVAMKKCHDCVIQQPYLLPLSLSSPLHMGEQRERNEEAGAGFPSATHPSPSSSSLGDSPPSTHDHDHDNGDGNEANTKKVKERDMAIRSEISEPHHGEEEMPHRRAQTSNESGVHDNAPVETAGVVGVAVEEEKEEDGKDAEERTAARAAAAAAAAFLEAKWGEENHPIINICTRIMGKVRDEWVENHLPQVRDNIQEAVTEVVQRAVKIVLPPNHCLQPPPQEEKSKERSSSTPVVPFTDPMNASCTEDDGKKREEEEKRVTPSIISEAANGTAAEEEKYSPLVLSPPPPPLFLLSSPLLLLEVETRRTLENIMMESLQSLLFLGCTTGKKILSSAAATRCTVAEWTSRVEPLWISLKGERQEDLLMYYHQKEREFRTVFSFICLVTEEKQGRRRLEGIEEEIRQDYLRWSHRWSMACLQHQQARLQTQINHQQKATQLAIDHAHILEKKLRLALQAPTVILSSNQPEADILSRNIPPYSSSSPMNRINGGPQIFVGEEQDIPVHRRFARAHQEALKVVRAQALRC